jgi:hypothetical protein
VQDQFKSTRVLRDSSWIFIIELVPSQFKHNVRSRRILWVKKKRNRSKLQISEEEEENTDLFSVSNLPESSHKDLCSNLHFNPGIFTRILSFTLQIIIEDSRLKMNGESKWKFRRNQKIQNETLIWKSHEDSPFVFKYEFKFVIRRENKTC